MPLLFSLPLSLTPFSALGLVAALVAAAVLGGLVYLRFFYVDLPPIRGLPEIPGGELLAGHLYQLGRDHATTAERWARDYGWPVFQMRMGYRRAVVLNSFASARAWIVQHQSATLDRPWFYTFHGVVSATSAATIGTSPWNERTKKQRRIVGSLTTAPSIQKLAPMLDLETAAMVAGLFYDSRRGAAEIMPHVYQKRVALNIMTMFCYGTRFASVEDPLLLQILADASTIASFRSTNANPQDYVPHLRYGPALRAMLGLPSRDSRMAKAVEVRTRRDTWLAAMLDTVRQRLPGGGDKKATAAATEGGKKSVAEMLLTDNTEGLTTLDIRTILGGLMSGGFETVYSTAIIAIGVLASGADGHRIQQRAYEDILAHYGGSPEDAFAASVLEEKSPYVAALAKEALRFYPPLKLLPARQTIKPFAYEEVVVPKGVLVYVNAQAANRDKATYGADADEFRPERWLAPDPAKPAATGRPGSQGGSQSGSQGGIPAPYHFAFGGGARMCTAVNFSNRVLYAMLLRLIVSFRFDASPTLPANTDYIGYKRDPTASNAIAADFRVRLTPRDADALERSLVRSQEHAGKLCNEELKR